MALTSNLIISPSSKTFDYWINEPFISQQLRDRLLQSNALLTPKSSYADADVLHFPKGTEDFLNFLHRENVKELSVDICIEDKDYKELSLHFDVLQLPDIIVQLVAAPVIVVLITKYLEYRLGSRKSKTALKCNVTIDDKANKRTVNITYDGPSDEFDKVAAQTIKLMNSSQALQTLEETADLEYEERLKRLVSENDAAGEDNQETNG